MTPTLPLRTLVVEDEWPARNYLVELLEASGLASVVGAVDNVDEARQVLAAESPGLGVEVVFADVELSGGGGGGESGLSLARAIASAEGAPMLVFATAHDLHALEAFELGAADYLLKPFGEERVTRALRRLHQLRAGARGVTDGPPRIVARRRRSLVFLEPNEIWAFEAADRLTSVHTPHGTLDVSLSLAAVETSFGRPFVRVHRNWLVNAAHIRELERDSETKLFVGPGLASAGQGVWIPVARDRAAAVRDMLLANAAGVRQRS